MPSWPHCSTCRNSACSSISRAHPCSTETPSYTQLNKYNHERQTVKERITVKAILTVKEKLTVKIGQQSKRDNCQGESESLVGKTVKKS